MKRIQMVLGAGIVLAMAGKAESSARYLRHPIFQNLPRMEVRAESQFGYGDNGSLPFGLLGAFGIGVSDALTAGVYANFYTSDRDLPTRVRMVHGLGVFAEYAFDRGYAVVPYAGGRIGFLDPTGPSYPTVPYAAGYAGVKVPLSTRLWLSLAGTLHWAKEEDDFGAYNYKRKNASYRSDSADITIDAGLRYGF